MDPIQYYMMQNQMPQFGQPFGQMQGQMQQGLPQFGQQPNQSGQPGMQAGQMPQGLPQMQARPQLPSFTPPGQMQGGPISGGIQPLSPDGQQGNWLHPLMAMRGGFGGGMMSPMSGFRGF